jgi:hypothetical protein
VRNKTPQNCVLHKEATFMTDYYGIEDSDSLFDGPTRDSLVFKGVSYRNSNEMHRAVVADWLSAGGELCRGDIKEFLDESSEDLAATLERTGDWANFRGLAVTSLSALLSGQKRTHSQSSRTKTIFVTFAGDHCRPAVISSASRTA